MTDEEILVAAHALRGEVSDLMRDIATAKKGLDEASNALVRVDQFLDRAIQSLTTEQ
jgi:hypothetical protein